MRISLSLLSALFISIALLAIMANLVSHDGMGPTVNRPPIQWQLDTPSTTPEPDKIKPVLPTQPKTATPPQGPEVLIERSDDGDPSIPMPPLVPGGGIGKIWTPDPPGLPGDPGDTIRERTGSGGLVPLSQIQPLYPRELAAKGIEGWVSLRFDIRQDGSVGNVQILDGSPRGVFDQAARQAVQRWRYRPTEAVPLQQTVTLDFRLDQ